MIPPLDPFSASFDSIEIESARSSAAYEHALALAAPTAAAPELGEPGFYLLDDAGGRFVVDREIGVISVKDDAIVASERGQEHGVRLRVVEASGLSYELDMRLRITGRVPQMADGEDFFGAEAAPPRIPDLKPCTRIALAPERPRVAWERFAAWQGAGAAAPISHCGGAPYGSLLDLHLPNAKVDVAALALPEPAPAPAGRNAIWTI